MASTFDGDLDPGDGLTDELAAQIRADLETQAQEERRPHVVIREAEDGKGIELVLFADEAEEDELPPVVTSLSAQDARALAAELLRLAGD